MDLLNKPPKNANLPFIDSPVVVDFIIFHHFSWLQAHPSIHPSTSTVGGSHHIEEVGEDGEAHVAGGFQHPVAGQVLRKRLGQDMVDFERDFATENHGDFSWIPMGFKRSGLDG